VSKIRAFAVYWLPPLIWMCLIFSASGDAKSFQHSSRIIGPLFQWLFPHASEQTVNFVVLVARKCAHVTEYTILAWLLWRALRRPKRNDPRPWSWRLAVMVVLLVMLYAASDEFHQRFVPSRTPSVHDVMIDTCGGALGMIVLWLFSRLAKRAA
jgi:VanZ family protein